MGQTPDEMLSAVAASLQARTGRSLPAWIALVQASGVDPLDQRAVRRWLRAEHGRAAEQPVGDRRRCGAGRRLGAADVAAYVDSQYRGAKAALRPIYDALEAAISGLGDDVTIEGRATYTPFVGGGSSPRSRQRPGTGSISGCASPTRRRWAGSSRRRRPAGHP